MVHDRKESDPEASEEREATREMIDQNREIGPVVAHLYRAEVDREVAWRERLDSTTNWAVTLIAAILAYAFSREDVAHAIILAGMLIGVVFLWIEARRFQRYDIWRSRVRSMQENLFANVLDPAEGLEQRDWRHRLSEDYRHPETKIPLRNALAHRLRRVYLPLLGGLLLVWLFRLNGGDASLLEAAAVSNTPGWIVFGAVVAGYACLLAIAIWPNAAAATETSDTVDRGDLGGEP